MAEMLFEDQVLYFTTDEAFKVIESICKDLGYEPKKYLIFKDTGGFGYVLDRLASDFFMSMKPIDTIIRYRMACLHVAYHTGNFYNLFSLNEQHRKEEVNSWEWEKKEKELKKLRVECTDKIKSLITSKDTECLGMTTCGGCFPECPVNT